jgi:hypothetical protein
MPKIRRIKEEASISVDTFSDKETTPLSKIDAQLM